MGLLDAIFGGDSGGGLLSGLPREWQYQNPPSQGFSNGPIFAGQPDQKPLNPVEQQMMSLLSRPGYQPGLPDPVQGAPLPLGAPAQQPMPAQPAASPIAVGGYQMPRMGNPDLYQPQQVNTPPQAQPTQGTSSAPPAVQAAFMQPPTQSGFGGAMRGALANMQGGPLGLLTGAIAGGLGMGQGNELDIARQNQQAQYQAFIGAGMTPQNAMLAVLNPEAGKTLINEALTNKVDYKTEKDALGAEHGFWINKIDQTKIQADGSGSGGNGLSGSPSILAQGATYDPNKTGEDYLNQFSPDVKASVKAYLNGDIMPTGNPRNQTINSYAKNVALRYAQDMGIPAGDSIFSEKRKYRTELGSNAPSTVGGSAKAFNQGISHLSDLADNLEKLKNWNGLGIPILAKGANYMREGMSNDQAAIADEARSLGQTVAGEVGKLFSGNAGGGVHERELTRERFDTVKSMPQLAAALRATIETMHGGLTALEQGRDRTLGPNSGVNFVEKGTQQKIDKIQEAIDRLEGKSTASTAAPSALPSGWSVKVR